MTQRTRAVAVLAALCGIAAGSAAFARGPESGFSFFNFTPFWSAPQPHESVQPSRFEDDGDEQPAPRPHHARTAAHRGGAAVCVRLCDGFFFPTQSTAGGDAACAAQCPGAPTALYTMTSDRIDDAISLTGAPYSKLPVAKRYETSSDATCSCHRDGFASRAKQLLSDPTLRKGDVVMTSDGFRVYEGGASGSQSFVALSQARDVSKELRGTLTALERASAGSPAISRPETLVARPKGNVTVDNGEPPPSP